LRSRPFRERRAENRKELLAMLHARVVRREPRVARELGTLEHAFGEERELAVRPDGEEERSVLRLDRAIRLERRVRVAVALRLPARRERRLADVDEGGERRGQEVRPDVATDAIPSARRE